MSGTDAPNFRRSSRVTLAILTTPVLAIAMLACGSDSRAGPDASQVDLAIPDSVSDLAPTDVPLPPPDGRPDPVSLDPGPDPYVDVSPADGSDEPMPEPEEDLPADATIPDTPPPIDAFDAGPDCPPSEPFDYKCDPKVPSTCPSGVCVLGSCLAPLVDPLRWSSCSDGMCSPCETAAGCPADCQGPPVMTGAKEYDNGTTLTLWVHGFSNKSPGEMKDIVYGHDRGCGGPWRT